MNEPFLIFGMGRSGSSTLEHSIQAGINKGNTAGEILMTKSHNRKKLMEPEFHEDRVESLYNILDNLHNEENYIALRSNLFNLEFTQKLIELTHSLFEYYDKIVWNSRESILKGVVSFEIAKKTDNWSVEHIDKKSDLFKDSNTWEVNINRLECKCERRRKVWNIHKRFIENSDISSYPASYERVYGIKDIDYRLTEVKKIVKWLGFEFDEENVGHIKELLRPERKINNTKTYRLIENIDEINEKLGPKFGFLY